MVVWLPSLTSQFHPEGPTAGWLSLNSSVPLQPLFAHLCVNQMGALASGTREAPLMRFSLSLVLGQATVICCGSARAQIDIIHC